ncbi:hypothetical protein AQ938_06765 [Burkholderia pseudomallei]|nr:hypothetical protein BURPSPAST_C1390 [Burkholderia pseudomallei Pasteur 52237]OND78977.1 hypothetical protein AQ938_06765 [Burkholderia pseudomallei]
MLVEASAGEPCASIALIIRPISAARSRAAFYGQDLTLWEKKMGFVMCVAFIAGTLFGCLVMGLLSGANR